VQVAKTVRAAEEHGVRAVVLAGGVAANRALRDGLAEALGATGIDMVVPAMSLCTDNASMIAAAAHDRLRAGRFLGLGADAVPHLPLNG
jgi:N6-L-threonylcarbamoyladenine synthase